MKQVYKFDSSGVFIEPIILYPDNNGKYTLPLNCTDKELPQPNWKPVFKDGQWVEIATKDEIDTLTGNTLENARLKKYKELDHACESSILGRFKATIDGLEYEFSNDEKAQSRFNGTGYLFSEGMIIQVEWTTYLQGERTSISLTKEKFDIVALAALNHTNSNIEKFRQKINQLNLAQTIDEVNAITW